MIFWVEMQKARRRHDLLLCLLVPLIILLWVGGIVGLFISSKGYALLWPYALMQMGMNANRREDALAGQYGLFVLSCILWLAAMFALAWALMKKRDVKA